MKNRPTTLTVFYSLVLITLLFCGCGKQNTPTDAGMDTSAQAETNLSNSQNNEKNTAEKENGTSTMNSSQENKSDDSGLPNDDSQTDADTSGQALPSANQSSDSNLARPSVNGALHVEGTSIVDEKSNPVVLHGISTHGLAWFPDYVNQDCFMQLSREFGANLIRLAMYTDEYGGYCSGGNQSDLKKLILDGVKYAKAADMYVIVDWHILHDNNPLTNKDQALQFFDEMTDALKGEDHVIYEICNEPNSGTSWDDVKAYAGEVLPVIRKNEPDAIVLIGTPTWCQEIDKPQNDPITGYDNLMYTLHFYAATHKEDLRDKMVRAIEAGTPVFVSEYGLCDASGNGGNDLNQAKQWIDTMDAHSVSYAVWSLCNKDETAALIKSSCQKTSGFSEDDLSESGKWIYEMLTKDSMHPTSPASGTTNSKSNQTSSGNQSNSAQTDGLQDKSDSSKSDFSGANVSITTGKNLQITSEITGSWKSDGKTFYQYSLTISNTGSEAINSWEISLDFTDDFNLSDGWNASYTQDGQTLILKNMDYNGEISKDGTVADIGFIVSGSSDLKIKEK